MVSYKRKEVTIHYDEFKKFLLKGFEDKKILNERINVGWLSFDVKLDLEDNIQIHGGYIELFEHLGIRDVFANDKIHSIGVDYDSGKFLFFKIHEPSLCIRYKEVI